MLAAGNMKDLWMPLLCLTLLAISAIYGLVDLLTGATLRRCPSTPPPHLINTVFGPYWLLSASVICRLIVVR